MRGEGKSEQPDREGRCRVMGGAASLIDMRGPCETFHPSSNYYSSMGAEGYGTWTRKE